MVLKIPVLAFHFFESIFPLLDRMAGFISRCFSTGHLRVFCEGLFLRKWSAGKAWQLGHEAPFCVLCESHAATPSRAASDYPRTPDPWWIIGLLDGSPSPTSRLRPPTAFWLFHSLFIRIYYPRSCKGEQKEGNSTLLPVGTYKILK